MILYFCFLIIEIFLFLTAPSNMEKPFMTYCLLAVVAQLVIFFRFDRKKVHSLKEIHLRHTSIFLACFFVVFFQCDIDYVIGLIDSSNKMLWIDTNIVCKSLALSTIALTSLLIGYKLLQNRDIESPIIKESHYDYICSAKHYVCILGYVMLAFYLIFVPRDYLYGGYNEGVDRGWVNVVLVLLQAVFLGMFALYCYDFRRSKERKSFLKELKFPVLLILLYMAIVLITGRRTEAVRAALLLVIVYSYSMGKNASNKFVLLYFFAAAILFSVVGILRMGEVRGFDQGIEAASETTSFSPFTRELAGSVNTLHVAVSHFPDVVDYNYGITFFPSFFVLVPGLDRFYQAYIVEGDVPLRSGQVITTLNLGPNASYGMGSSIVADVYISFGPIGVVVVFILLGMFLRYLEVGTFCIDKSPLFLVLSFGCCSQFMFACRGSVAIMFLSWSYGTILVFLLVRRKMKLQHIESFNKKLSRRFSLT